MQFIHVFDQPVIDPVAAPCIGDLPLAFNAHDRNQVTALVEQFKIAFVHIGTVCKNGEQNTRFPAGRFNDIPSQHRFAACQQDKADPQFICLIEYSEPFLAGQLAYRFRIHGCMVAAGIAARAVEVALAGNAGDQKRRNVFSCIFRNPALFRGNPAGRGKLCHKNAFPRIL